MVDTRNAWGISFMDIIRSQVLVDRVANCTLWFLKPPHIEAKEELIYSVKILGGSSSVLELLETIGNSV